MKNINSTNKNNTNTNKLTTIISAICLIIGCIVSIISYKILPKSQKVNGSMVLFSTFLMLSAFSPQLIQNYLYKNKATDHVVPEFLIITALGVILKIPSFKRNLSRALEHKKDIELNYILVISIFIPLIAHVIWQWQCAIYNSDASKLAKDIFKVSAPIFTVMVIILFIWAITAKPIR